MVLQLATDFPKLALGIEFSVIPSPILAAFPILQSLVCPTIYMYLQWKEKDTCLFQEH